MKSKIQMREDKLNVNLIKELLTDEINEYFKSSKKSRLINNQIDLSEQMIKAIEEKRLYFINEKN